jgi:hypothetical protein
MALATFFLRPLPIHINGSVGSYQYYIGAIDSISGEYKWRRDFWQMRLVGDMHYIFGEDIILIKQLRQASDWGSLEAFSAVDGSIACYLGEILQDHYSIEGIYGGCGPMIAKPNHKNAFLEKRVKYLLG